MPVKKTPDGLIEISGGALSTLQRELPLALFGIHHGAMCVVCLGMGSWKSADGEAEFQLTGVCESCFDANEVAASFRHVEAGLAHEGDTRGISQAGVEFYLSIMRARKWMQMRPETYKAMIQRLAAEPVLPRLQRRSKVVDAWHTASTFIFLEEGCALDSGLYDKSELANALAATLIGVIVFQDRAGRAVVFKEVQAAGVAGSADVTVSAKRAVLSKAGPRGDRTGYLQSMGEPRNLCEAWREEPLSIAKVIELACSPERSTGLLAPAIDRCLRTNEPSHQLFLWVPMTMEAQSSDSN